MRASSQARLYAHIRILFGCIVLTAGSVHPGIAQTSSDDGPVIEAGLEDARILGLVFPVVDIEALRSRGPSILPVLARQYREYDEDHRAVIADVFYQLGWKSPDARRALMTDVRTGNRELRVRVQWALGRVSNDAEVVEALIENMRNDPEPHFRYMAACALANDQIHLTAGQRFMLLSRLIGSLRDPEMQVRLIAAKALEAHTGQTKGFDPNGSVFEREKKVLEWETWLSEYRDNL